MLTDSKESVNSADSSAVLAPKSGRRITSEDMIHTRADLFIERGAPTYLRSDNGPDFITKAVRDRLERLSVKTLFIEPGCARENGNVKSLNGKLRDEVLNGEIFYTLTEAEVLLERRRIHCNTRHPHSSLGHRPRAFEAIRPPSNHLSLN
jgi:putative transposase